MTRHHNTLSVLIALIIGLVAMWAVGSWGPDQQLQQMESTR